VACVLFWRLGWLDPINAGRLHGDGAHAGSEQPIARFEQIIGEGAERAYGFRIRVEWHGHLNLRGANVDAGGVRMERGQLSIGFGC
jgi:hypothetical protein